MPEENVSRSRVRKMTIRNTIIKAAEDIFLEKGYRLASVDEIADRADVTKRTLYKHFPSKLALFIFMFDVYLSKLEKEFSARTKDGPATEKDIKKNFQALFTFTLKNEKFMRLYWMIDTHEFEGEIPPELVAHVNRLTNRMLEAHKSSVIKARDNGVIADLDPMLLVHLLSAINKGIFIHANKEKRFDIAEINPQELFDLLLVILDEGLFIKTGKGGSKK